MHPATMFRTRAEVLLSSDAVKRLNMSTEFYRMAEREKATDKIVSLVNLGILLECLLTGKEKASHWASRGPRIPKVAR